jgi:UrcA family protein
MQGHKTLAVVAALLSGTFGYAAPATAQEAPVFVYGEAQPLKAERVHFADLNLARTRDRIRLGHRVQGAIERVCDIDLGRDGLQDHGYYQCANAAWFRAVPQISYAANRALMGYRGRTSVATAILVIGR